MENENNGCIGNPITNLLMQQAAEPVAEPAPKRAPVARKPAAKKPAAKKPAAKKPDAKK